MHTPTLPWAAPPLSLPREAAQRSPQEKNSMRSQENQKRPQILGLGWPLSNKNHDAETAATIAHPGLYSVKCFVWAWLYETT